jgi:ankyrin repeat protein
MAQIHDAADQGDFAEVKRLLTVGVNVNTPAEDGWPPLNIAALQGHSAVAKYLIEQGADIEATSPGEFRPLFVAAQEGHLDTVKLLIKNNAMIDARSNDGGTALYNAALNGHTEVVDFLISAGAEVDALALNQGTPLAVASQQGHLDVVRLLAREGANIEVANIDGFTSLHIAAQEGHEDVVKFLLEQGADVDARNHAGSTPDDIASLHGHPKITELIAGKRVQNPGGGVYCRKCGKGVIMSWTCPKCGKLLCDTCSGLTTTQPEIHEGFTSQTLGGGNATCPYCDSGSGVTGQSPIFQASKEDAEIIEFLRAKQLIPAIKCRRIQTGEGLKDAKEYVEELARKYNLEPPSTSGCFIATACYGDINCPQVNVLRQYRDEEMLHKVLGRILVSIYYAVSPPIAEWLKSKPRLASALRKKVLDKIVKRIDKGN